MFVKSNGPVMLQFLFQGKIALLNRINQDYQSIQLKYAAGYYCNEGFWEGYDIVTKGCKLIQDRKYICIVYDN